MSQSSALPQSSAPAPSSAMPHGDVPMPLFLDEEKATFDRLLMDFARSRSNLFCLRCRNLAFGARDAELVATAYLLTNVILMARASRKILKAVSLSTAHPEQLHAQMNVWRALFGSSYASLGNIRKWRAALGGYVSAAGDITAEVERAIEFFANADLGVATAGFERAEVYLGVEGRPTSDLLGGQFELTMPSAFCPTLVTSHHREALQLNGIYSRPGFIIRSGGHGRNLVLEVDGSQLDTALHSWMGAISTLTDFKFYRSTAIV